MSNIKALTPKEFDEQLQEITTLISDGIKEFSTLPGSTVVCRAYCLKCGEYHDGAVREDDLGDIGGFPVMPDQRNEFFNKFGRALVNDNKVPVALFWMGHATSQAVAVNPEYGEDMMMIAGLSCDGLRNLSIVFYRPDLDNARAVNYTRHEFYDIQDTETNGLRVDLEELEHIYAGAGESIVVDGRDHAGMDRTFRKHV